MNPSGVFAALPLEKSRTPRMFATWSSDNASELERFVERHGRRPVVEPERLRAALFHDPRFGGLGALRDLHDLSVLVHHVHLCWVAVRQAAQALSDRELERVADEHGSRTNRQMNWLRTQIKLRAPQALTVRPETSAELKSSVPRAPAPAAMPDLLWAPLATALLLLGVGGLGWISGNPWLLPSLGPSAYLVAEDASHPSARVYNIVVGHLVGLAAGFLAIFLLGGWAAPVVLVAKTLPAIRLWAAVLAMAVTLLVCLVLRANHPPAAATTLLVALGSLQTGRDALNVAIGAVLLAAIGVGLRWLRMGKGRIKAERALAPAMPQPPEIAH